jgi:uncharacterized membrane protein YgdD (TMEM256/DUF423 family)
LQNTLAVQLQVLANTNMKKETILLWASITGGLAVVIGAFGAHALKSFLASTSRTDTFELAVRYQFYHALALFCTGLVMFHFESKRLSLSAVFFVVGIFLFSGSLYVLCFTGLKLFGAVTPFGGVFLIAGWVFLALGILYGNKKAS